MHKLNGCDGMSQKFWIFILAFVGLILHSASGSAEKSNPWVHALHFENDLFNGTDSNYTNGVKYSAISPDLSPHANRKNLSRLGLEILHKIPFIEESTPDYTHKVEFSLGQNMYTPHDITRKDLIRDDRPYSGWTYFSTAYHRKYLKEGRIGSMDTVEIQIGIVGPESLAEDTQKYVHELRDINKPEGWDHQLENELGLAAIFERKWLLHVPEKDQIDYSAICHLGASLGNVHTYLNSGLEWRLGWSIPKDFGVSLIRPAGSTRLEIGEGFTAYFFAAANGKAIARDIFLDGNTFADSHSIDKNYFVADVAGGFAIGYKRLIITLTEVVRTKEFKGQEDAHSFGSIAVSFSIPFEVNAP